MTKKITFGADRVKVNGPKADGGLTVSFDTGEFMQQEVAKLFLIPQNTAVTVTVEYDDFSDDAALDDAWQPVPTTSQTTVTMYGEPDQQPTS